MPAVFLADRSVIAIAGEDARKFLQGLVTCDMGKVAPGAPGFGALLTPQGKILFDFLIVEQDGRFLLDTAREKTSEFLKRLGMYKLRSKVELADLSAESAGDAALAVCALFGAGAPEPPPEAVAYDDPRAENLGRRAIMPAGLARAFAADDPGLYEAHRIACGAPKAGLDFPFGDAFPHEANMDLLHGVAFDKGCYVGQEVVSRMQHRSLVRKRFARVALDGSAEAGAEIRAGEIAIGSLGGVQGGAGLALVRLDRLEEAQGRELRAGAATVRVL